MQQINNSLKFNAITINSTNFIFDIDNTISIDFIDLNIFMKSIIFHIIIVNTSFLLCLIDMNKLKTFFNNMTNKLIQLNRMYFVIRKYDHVFFMWHTSIYSLVFESLNINLCYLIEIDFCRLHRRFDHFSMQRFQTIFDCVDHDVDLQIFDHFTKYCEHCQKHNRLFDCFRFIIKNEIEFNFNIIVNIIHFDEKLMFHIVDKTICFQTKK